jgi:hypothetical protein
MNGQDLATHLEHTSGHSRFLSVATNKLLSSFRTIPLEDGEVNSFPNA